MPDLKVTHLVRILGGGIGQVVSQLLEAQLEIEGLDPMLVLQDTAGHYYQEIKAKKLPNIVTPNFSKTLRQLQQTDLIHIHATDIDLFCAAALARKPIIYTFHGQRTFTSKSVAKALKSRNITLRGAKRLVEKILFYFFLRFVVKKITAVSPFIKQKTLTQYKLPPEKITIIPNGIDLDSIDKITPLSKQDLDLSENTFVIGTVTSFNRQFKSNRRIIKTMSYLQEREPNFEFKSVIVGDGPNRKNIEKLASKVGVEEDTQFLGFREDVFRIYPVMDIFLLPSKGEAFPMVCLEAMSQKVPVLAFSDSGGAREIIEESQGGKIAQEEKEMAKKIIHLANHPELRTKYGEKGRCYIEKEWTIQQIALKYYKLYQNSLKDKNI